MKKTIDINLGGIIFHIDDDAYESLNAYLDRIKKHFSSREGGGEVCSDIESRIAEILRDKLAHEKQVITLEDIKEVISVMGEPGEIEGEPSPGKGEHRHPRRLYRDPQQRILGGVCGGLGLFFNLDPVIFRILFIVIAFSGFGILLYLVLWVITPVAESVTDRLEMRGEPVTIANIEKSVRKEWDQVRGSLNSLAAEAKGAYVRSKPGIGVFFEELAGALVAVLKGAWGIVRVVLGICLILIAVAFAIAVGVGLLGSDLPN